MNFGLRGKVIAVTGGASGIGLATAALLAKDSARVAILDIDKEGIGAAVTAIKAAGGEAKGIEVDVRDEASVARAATSVAETLGPAYGLVACAGVSAAAKSEDLTLEELNRVLSVNTVGVFLTCQAVARKMIAQGRGGRIIAISSGAAKIPLKGSGDYCVSKAGVWMLMKCMALELGRYQITANAIGPGVIDTPMTKELQASGRVERIAGHVPLGRIGRPEDVANTALFLASEEGSYFSGSILHPDGGIIMQ